MPITLRSIVTYALLIGIIAQMVLFVMDPGESFIVVGLLNVVLFCIHLIFEIENPKKDT